MKNLKSTEPVYLGLRDGWYVDIYIGKRSGRDNDICTVWGSTEEELNHRVAMIKKSYEMHEAWKNFMIIVNDSEGITGYHLNGDILQWGEIEEIHEIESLIKELES